MLLQALKASQDDNDRSGEGNIRARRTVGKKLRLGEY